jgi:hypothetical protein
MAVLKPHKSVKSPDVDEIVKRDIATRWTPTLAKSFTGISTYFLDHYSALNPPLRYSEALLVIHLIRHKWGKEAPYPSWARLAAYMGLTPMAVRNIARSLENKGYLLKAQRKTGTKTNNFHLEPLFAALEKHLATNPAGYKVRVMPVEDE